MLFYASVHFKVKKTTSFSKVFAAYASKLGKDKASLRFMHDGSRIDDTATPESLGLEDNDAIDAMVCNAVTFSLK